MRWNSAEENGGWNIPAVLYSLHWQWSPLDLCPPFRTSHDDPGQVLPGSSSHWIWHDDIMLELPSIDLCWGDARFSKMKSVSCGWLDSSWTEVCYGSCIIAFGSWKRVKSHFLLGTVCQCQSFFFFFFFLTPFRSARQSDTSISTAQSLCFILHFSHTQCCLEERQTDGPWLFNGGLHVKQDSTHVLQFVRPLYARYNWENFLITTVVLL